MVRTKDVVSITEARAKLTELAEEVATAGAEKLLTKNGASFVALIDARKLDYDHALETEHANLVLLDEVERGLADVAAGRTSPVRELRRRLRR
jgi:prevent-host-death family protein